MEEEIEQRIRQIHGLDKKAMEEAGKRWDQIAKPLNSLGLLEEMLIQIAGISGSSQICLDKKAVLVFCGDNGIVEEGVTQTGQEVTAVVAENLARGDSCVCIMAEKAKAAVYPVDMGVSRKLTGYGEFADGRDGLDHTGNVRYPILNRRLMAGTRNYLYMPAMDRNTAVQGILSGMDIVGQLKKRGYSILATGEMGIGNTTTSSAVISVLLNKEPELVTGRGAGLSTEGLERKREVIRRGIAQHKPDAEDGIDVLAKVGGLDLAGLTGAFLGGAFYRIPVVIDGLISAAAALTAARICPAAREYMLASHMSAEPAGQMVLSALAVKPLIYGNLCLGEGTGAVAIFPLLDMAAAIYQKMSTFSQIQIEEYQHFQQLER